MYSPPALRTPKGSIVLQTLVGESIDNFQDLSPVGSVQLGQQRFWLAQFGKQVVPRTSPDPFYNCHGLVFASRRTAILDDSEVACILYQDRYREVDNIKEVLAGDIVVYLDLDSSKIVHSGLVVRYEKNEDACPTIVSKWGYLGEFVHPVLLCPKFGAEKLEAKYYRINRNEHAT